MDERQRPLWKAATQLGGITIPVWRGQGECRGKHHQGNIQPHPIAESRQGHEGKQASPQKKLYKQGQGCFRHAGHIINTKRYYRQPDLKLVWQNSLTIHGWRYFTVRSMLSSGYGEGVVSVADGRSRKYCSKKPVGIRFECSGCRRC